MNLGKYCILFLTLAMGIFTHAQAATVALANNQWAEFNVDDIASPGVAWIDLTDSNSPTFGTPLTYQFTIAQGFKGNLNLVDGGFAGDRFEVFNNGISLGSTSLTTNNTEYSNDFENNLSNSNFSHGLLVLNAGTYNITGTLYSTLQPFNATNGAVKLEVTSVPLPGSLALLAGSLGLLVMRRRRV